MRNVGRTHGQFITAERTSAGTTELIEAKTGGSIVITDIIVNTDKVNNATCAVQFTDGTNTEVLTKCTVTDAPANYSIAPQGLFRSWKNARLDMVTVNGVKANVTVGYYKVNGGLEYSAWNDER